MISVNREMGCEKPAKVNVDGSAIALDHLIGAFSGRVPVVLQHEVVCRDARKGLAILKSIGDGQYITLAVKCD